MAAPLHPGWITLWAPELSAPVLREALVGHGGYTARIEADLLRAHFNLRADPEHLEGSSREVAEFLGRIGPDTQRRAGLMWCAPALCGSLRPLAGLSGIDADLGSLRVVLEYRNHSAGENVEAPEDAEAVDREGARCLSAWLHRQSPETAARLCLRLDPAVVAPPGELATDTARAAIFDAALATPAEAA